MKLFAQVSKFVSASLAIAFSAAPVAQIVQGQAVPLARYGAWETVVVALPDSIPHVRTTTFDEQGYSNVVVDFFPPACSLQMSFFLPYDSPAEETSVRDLHVSLRVDERRMYGMAAFANVTMGDRYGMVTLATNPRFADLVNDMKAGHQLRTQHYLPGFGSSYMTYRLNGFTAAFNKATELCEKARDRML